MCKRHRGATSTLSLFHRQCCWCSRNSAMRSWHAGGVGVPIEPWRLMEPTTDRNIDCLCKPILRENSKKSRLGLDWAGLVFQHGGCLDQLRILATQQLEPPVLAPIGPPRVAYHPGGSQPKPTSESNGSRVGCAMGSCNGVQPSVCISVSSYIRFLLKCWRLTNT